MESKTTKLVHLALLTALEVVLSRFLSISTPITKFGFAFVPLALSGMLYGPMAGLAVGAVSDLLGATLFPTGPFFPGFTLTTAFKGLIYGLCLNRQSIGRWKPVLFSVTFNAVVFSLVLNTIWIHMISGAAFSALLLSRAAQELVLIPVQVLVLRALNAPALRRLWNAIPQ